MNEDIDAIKARLEELKAAIAEVKRRMPAHSAKPPIMRRLFELEDEFECLQKKMKAVSS